MKNIFKSQLIASLSKKCFSLRKAYVNPRLRASEQELGKQIRISKNYINLLDPFDAKDLIAVDRQTRELDELIYKTEALKKVEAKLNKKEKEKVLAKYSSLGEEELRKIKIEEEEKRKRLIEDKAERELMRIKLSEEEFKIYEKEKDEEIKRERVKQQELERAELEEKKKEQFENSDELMNEENEEIQDFESIKASLENSVPESEEFKKQAEEEFNELYNEALYESLPESLATKIEKLGLNENPDIQNLMKRSSEYDYRFEDLMNLDNLKEVVKIDYFKSLESLARRSAINIYSQRDFKNNYIYVKSQEITKEVNDFIKDPYNQRELMKPARTDDGYRVDVALVIQRKPIFLNVDDKDMEFMKYRRDFMKKYHFDYDKIKDDIEIFNDIKCDLWELTEAHTKTKDDNQINFRKKKEDGTYQFYSLHSKNWRLVDPTVNDRHSIQYAGKYRTYMVFKNKISGKWEFPSTPLIYGDSMKSTADKLVTLLTRNKYTLHFPSTAPFLQVTRDLYAHEKKIPDFSTFKGVRTYFLPLYHYEGYVSMMHHDRIDYEDYAFITKNEMNKFFDENYYKSVIHSVLEF